MPKIDSSSLNFVDIKESKVKKKNSSNTKNRFDSLLKKNKVDKVLEVKDFTDDDIMDMYNDIDELGKKMIKNFNQDNVKKYTDAVRSFISFVVDNAYEVKTKNFKMKMGTVEVTRSLVDVLDNELNNLARTLLNEQVDNIKLLDKVGKIKGLLIDLTK